MDLSTIFGEPLLETSAGASLFMLSWEVNPVFPGSDTLSEFENGLTLEQEMRGLKRDLARLEKGRQPLAKDLAAAPLLKDWGFLDAGEVLPRIVGDLVGASKVGSGFTEGAQTATLQILAIDNDLGWARDRRGYYRLEHDHARET